MQRVVTVAGDSVVGAEGGWVKGPCYRRQEGYGGMESGLGGGKKDG